MARSLHRHLHPELHSWAFTIHSSFANASLPLPGLSRCPSLLSPLPSPARWSRRTPSTSLGREHPPHLLHLAKSCFPLKPQLNVSHLFHKSFSRPISPQDSLLIPSSPRLAGGGVGAHRCDPQAIAVCSCSSGERADTADLCPASPRLLDGHLPGALQGLLCVSPAPIWALSPRGSRCGPHPAGRLQLHPAWLCVKL